MSPLKAGHSNRIECNNNPVNYIDPLGLDSMLSIVTVRGGSYNYYGHAFIELNPIPGTGSPWSEKTSYGTFPIGLKKNNDLAEAYGDGLSRVRREIMITTEQEIQLKKFLQDFSQKNRDDKWSPQNNCASFAIDAWNIAVPADEELDRARASQYVNGKHLNDPRAQEAGALLYLQGKQVTPAQLGVYLRQLNSKSR